jgi:hypothetical protein
MRSLIDQKVTNQTGWLEARMFVLVSAMEVLAHLATQY